MSVTFKLNRNKKSLLITDSKVVKLKDEDLNLFKIGDLQEMLDNYMKIVYLTTPQLHELVNLYIQDIIDEKDPRYELCEKIEGLKDLRSIYRFLNKYGKLHSDNKPLPKTEEVAQIQKEKYRNLNVYKNSLSRLNDLISDTYKLSNIEAKYGKHGFMKMFSNFITELFNEIIKYDPQYDKEDRKEINDSKIKLDMLNGFEIPYSLLAYRKDRGDLTQEEVNYMTNFKIEFIKSLEEYIIQHSNEIQDDDKDLSVFMNTIRNIVNSATSYDLISLLSNIILKAEELSVNEVRSKAEQEELELKNVEKNQKNADVGRKQFAAAQTASHKDIIN